jgi:hypothetical protein
MAMSPSREDIVFVFVLSVINLPERYGAGSLTPCDDLLDEVVADKLNALFAHRFFR